MNLRYIAIGLDYETYIMHENKLRYEVQLHTRFISNYFSKEIRKLKFTTDGSYNMISVSLMFNELQCSKLVPSDVLKVYVPFDKKRYEIIKGTGDCSYYLELLEEGFHKAAEFKNIPLNSLINIINQFKAGGFKNEWVHKKKKLKEIDLEVSLFCEFTTNYFQLIITIIRASSKEELVKGALIKTEPYEVLFEKMFKDIVVDKENITITDASNSPRMIISLEDVFKKKFNYQILGDEGIKRILTLRV